MSRNPEQIITSALGISPDDLSDITEKALRGYDGELYLGQTDSMAIALEDGIIVGGVQQSSENGGIFRMISGDKNELFPASADFTGLTLDNLMAAKNTLKSYPTLAKLNMSIPTSQGFKRLYMSDVVIANKTSDDCIALLKSMDTYARGKDTRVIEVKLSMTMSNSDILMVFPDGSRAYDARPLVRLNTQVLMQDKSGRRETGSYGFGGRYDVTSFFDEKTWQAAVDEAIREGDVALHSIVGKGGSDMKVILGPGWPGVLLHEAVGHSLEGDAISKGQSAFTTLLGKTVAAKGVTVVEDGTIPNRRGSLSVDDEGIATQNTTLIKDGQLVGFIHDKMSAYRMGVEPTGNGRREDFTCLPMPRMTNTYMLAGTDSLQDMIASVKNGIYAVGFNGGQVDPVSGKFTFGGSEVYQITNGKIGAPLKGVAISGFGPEVLKGVIGIGDDFALDPGVGVCGKNGQGVPVGVGQPSVLLDKGVANVSGGA
jgi:TldD protein